MLPFKQVIYQEIKHGHQGVLVGDIGGTNSNFGLAQIVDGNAELVLSIHLKSALITDFTQTVADLLAYLEQTYAIAVHNACFAAAGVVAPKQEICKPTNLSITIDAKDIIKKTALSCACIVNDFEVIGYGINHINPKDIVVIQAGNEYKHGNKAILGAGTGLGKAILRWVESKNRYIPVASEGGHADFAAQTERDLEIITYIKKHEQSRCMISWEDLLCGKGVERIFGFFSVLNSTSNIFAQAPHPDEIFAHRYRDINCNATVEYYATLYARCAKNWALDALALGGIYIAGGIATHNIDMFKLKLFLQEFSKCSKQERILKSIPIWVIGDYNVSLYGAIEYMRLEGKCTI